MAENYQTELRQVTLEQIRSELRALWTSEGVDNDGVIRARSHNLVVHTAGDSADVDDTIQRIVEVSGARPGRVILVQADPEAEDRVEAWVTIYCQLQNHQQICGEMIVLSVGGSLREEIHSTVISLLAPDVPVYLWWMQCPDVDDHLYQTLSAEADRVLVDSDRFGMPEDLVKLAGQSLLPIGDLAWARLTPWRQQMAHLWDVPELRDALNNLRTIDVIYVAPGDFANANRALLMVGWLADRFGWELVEAHKGPTGGYTSHWEKAGWEGKAEIVESAYEGLPPGELMGIYMQAGETPPFVMPRLEYVVDRGCIDVRLDDASPSARRRGVHFTSMTEAQALVEELDQRYDPYYRLALSRAAEIVTAANR